MCKWFALGTVVIVAALGALFLGLDILDINEHFRLYLPTAILNTVFIVVVAVPVTCIAARDYAITGSPQMLWLGCGALAFAAGTLLRAWLVGYGLNVSITLIDSSALIASVLHLIGAGLSIARPRLPEPESGRKSIIVLSGYLGVLAGIALITLLAFQGVIPPFHLPGEGSYLLRDAVRGVAAIFFLAASSIYLRGYGRSRTDFLYWYALGLLLFALGIIFMSLGAVDGRIAWLGRVAQYAGGIYFLVAVLVEYRLAGTRQGG